MAALAGIAAILGAVALWSGGRDAGSGLPAPARTIHITVDEQGYHPPTVKAPAGERVRLEFERTADDGCGQQLFFPGEKLRRDLPLHRAVNVDITMPAKGSVAFTCSMGMYKGEVTVE